MKPVFINIPIQPNGNAEINVFAIVSVFRQGNSTTINTTDGKSFNTVLFVPAIMTTITTAIANAH